MKSKLSKDLWSIIALGVIFIIIGFLLVNYLGGGSKERSEEVEVFDSFGADFDAAGKQVLLNTTEVKDFVFPVDLERGFNNTNPFGSGN